MTDSLKPASPFVVACVQMTSSGDMDANLDTIDRLVRKAVSKEAQMVLLPENAVFMDRNRDLLAENAYLEDDHPGLAVLKDLARQTGIWLHCGSMPVIPEPPQKPCVSDQQQPESRYVNRSLVIDPTGTVRARYDKIHMFDVSLANGERYQESRTFRPGDTAVTVQTPLGNLGLSICYGLRFGQLYRLLAKAGADYLAIPAAFTHTTGQAHWHILIRARAIENGCFAFAPAQTGRHKDGRRTFGHALIVSPWGEILAESDDKEGVIHALIHPSQVSVARQSIPSLSHDRPFQLAERRPLIS